MQVNIALIFAISFALIAGCSGSEQEKDESTNPAILTDVDREILESYAAFGMLDSTLYKKGQEIYYTKCTGCHDLDSRKKGPPLRDVTKRHKAGWITDLLTNVSECSRIDSIISQSIKDTVGMNEGSRSDSSEAPSTTEEERRSLLEFLRGTGQSTNYE